MTNSATRLTVDEKLTLVTGRARLLGFRRHDLEDAVQEVMLAVLEFEYAPEKSNGATETTALTTVIDRRLKLLKRSQRRYAGLLERAAGHLAAEHSGFQEGAGVEDGSADREVLGAEIAAVMADMDEESQQVCRMLTDGLSTRRIADELQTSWHRADRLVAGIREKLQAAGFTPADAE